LVKKTQSNILYGDVNPNDCIQMTLYVVNHLGEINQLAAVLKNDLSSSSLFAPALAGATQTVNRPVNNGGGILQSKTVNKWAWQVVQFRSAFWPEQSLHSGRPDIVWSLKTPVTIVLC